MRRTLALMTVAMFGALAACGDQPEKVEKPEIEQMFFGQQAPGPKPKLFAPGIVSTDAFENLPAVSPDMQDVYFIRQTIGETPAYQRVSYRGGSHQTEPIEATSGLGEVFISPDGKTMHLGNEYRTLGDDDWSELLKLGAPFEDYPIMRLTASASGTYVFDVRDEVGTLRYSRLVDGERQAPVAFNDDINSGRWTAHPFIAPDESYLIWDSERPDGFGDTDLYISFRKEDGSWGPAINMGEDINTEMGEGFGSITPDGRYLIFNRTRIDPEDLESSEANIYWVDASVIERLRGA